VEREENGKWNTSRRWFIVSPVENKPKFPEAFRPSANRAIA